MFLLVTRNIFLIFTIDYFLYFNKNNSIKKTELSSSISNLIITIYLFNKQLNTALIYTGKDNNNKIAVTYILHTNTNQLELYKIKYILSDQDYFKSK